MLKNSNDKIEHLGQNNQRKGADFRMTDMAWNAFKKTGDINMYLEFKKMKQLEKKLKGSSNEASKGEWSYFS